MSGGLGSRTTTPKWDLILAALELGLQAWRTTASRDRFFDAIAELGHAREREARCVRAEEALRDARPYVYGVTYDQQPWRAAQARDVLAGVDAALAAVPEENEG